MSGAEWRDPGESCVVHRSDACPKGLSLSLGSALQALGMGERTLTPACTTTGASRWCLSTAGCGYGWLELKFSWAVSQPAVTPVCLVPALTGESNRWRLTCIHI